MVYEKAMGWGTSARRRSVLVGAVVAATGFAWAGCNWIGGIESAQLATDASAATDGATDTATPDGGAGDGDAAPRPLLTCTLSAKTGFPVLVDDLSLSDASFHRYFSNLYVGKVDDNHARIVVQAQNDRFNVYTVDFSLPSASTAQLFFDSQQDWGFMKALSAAADGGDGLVALASVQTDAGAQLTANHISSSFAGGQLGPTDQYSISQPFPTQPDMIDCNFLELAPGAEFFVATYRDTSGQYPLVVGHGAQVVRNTAQATLETGNMMSVGSGGGSQLVHFNSSVYLFVGPSGSLAATTEYISPDTAMVDGAAPVPIRGLNTPVVAAAQVNTTDPSKVDLLVADLAASAGPTLWGGVVNGSDLGSIVVAQPTFTQGATLTSAMFTASGETVWVNDDLVAIGAGQTGGLAFFWLSTRGQLVANATGDAGLSPNDRAI